MTDVSRTWAFREAAEADYDRALERFAAEADPALLARLAREEGGLTAPALARAAGAVAQAVTVDACEVAYEAACAATRAETLAALRAAGILPREVAP